MGLELVDPRYGGSHCTSDQSLESYRLLACRVVKTVDVVDMRVDIVDDGVKPVISLCPPGIARGDGNVHVVAYASMCPRAYPQPPEHAVPAPCAVGIHRAGRSEQAGVAGVVPPGVLMAPRVVLLILFLFFWPINH